MQDFLPIKKVDHVELYVGNAKQAVHYYESVFGFSRVAYRGLETGEREVTSYAIRQNDVIFVLSGEELGASPHTAALRPEVILPIGQLSNPNSRSWLRTLSP